MKGGDLRSTDLDLKPGVLGTQANVAGCDQVNSCHGRQHLSLHIVVLKKLRARSSSRAHLLQYRHHGRQPQQAWDTTEGWREMISVLWSRTEYLFTLQV